MRILLWVVSALFGGLSLIASLSQMKGEEKPAAAGWMAAGSLMLLAAVGCGIGAKEFDFIVALVGCAAICAAAIWNGMKSGQFHLRHHIIRGLLSIALIVGFILL